MFAFVILVTPLQHVFSIQLKFSCEILVMDWLRGAFNMFTHVFMWLENVF